MPSPTAVPFFSRFSPGRSSGIGGLAGPPNVCPVAASARSGCTSRDSQIVRRRRRSGRRRESTEKKTASRCWKREVASGGAPATVAARPTGIRASGFFATRRHRAQSADPASTAREFSVTVTGARTSFFYPGITDQARGHHRSAVRPRPPGESTGGSTACPRHHFGSGCCRAVAVRQDCWFHGAVPLEAANLFWANQCSGRFPQERGRRHPEPLGPGLVGRRPLVAAGQHRRRRSSSPDRPPLRRPQAIPGRAGRHPQRPGRTQIRGKQRGRLPVRREPSAS